MNAIAQPTAQTTARTTPHISRRSLDQLERDIVSLSQHINASEYEFLVLLREFDLRQGWKAYHFNHCAEWLNMKCGMAPGTAREKLRVANALFDLPLTSRAFQKGDLSYSKARALSRVATPRSEEHLLDFALKANAAAVDRHCLELRNVDREVSTADANAAHNRRYLCYSPHSDGSVTISVELPAEQAGLLLKALELATSRMTSADADYFEDGVGDSAVSEFDDNAPRGASALQRKQADALVEIARSYLAGGFSSESFGESTGESAGENREENNRETRGERSREAGGEGNREDSGKGGDKCNVEGNKESNGENSGRGHGESGGISGGVGSGESGGESSGNRRRTRTSCTADHYQVMVHVDERALRGAPDRDSKSDLPIETVRRLCCDGAITPIVQDETGQPLNSGRKHRVVNPQLRRMLLARDKGCRFPGCTHSKWLDAHHVVHWADGGETTPENLVMLCSKHHRLLHEGGFEIKPGPNGDWQFRNASGYRQFR